MRNRVTLVLSAIILSGVLLTVMTASVSAAGPQLVNHQGILLDGAGDPVIVATSIEFRIYDAPAAGALLWSEAQMVTPDADGRFNALMGSVVAIPDTAFAGDAYLALKVGADPEMVQRQRLVSVPFTYRTRSVDDASGGAITSSLGIGTTPGVRLHVGDVEDQDALRIGSRGDIFDWNFYQDVAGIGSLRLKDGSGNLRMAWVAGGGGEVGIGTPNPTAKLTVVSSEERTGLFTSDFSSSSTTVVGGHYVGAGSVDAVGVQGFSAPVDGFGIGGQFVGGWIGVHGYAQGPGPNYAGYFDGDVGVTGTLSKGAGSFKIDHPLDPENKYLYHSFVESPDMMNVYNGNVILDADGSAVVELPDYFEALNSDFRYQLTAIGAPGPNLYVQSEINDGRFTVAGGSAGAKVSWQVTGVRQDAFAKANRIPVEEVKPVAERGFYLHPEAIGEPLSKRIDYKLKKKIREQQSASSVR